MLPRIQPINPLRIQTPVDDTDFICEIKHDGFRALAHSEGGSSKLVSRKQVVYKSRPFASLSTLLGELPVRDAILDGELVHSYLTLLPVVFLRMPLAISMMRYIAPQQRQICG